MAAPKRQVAVGMAMAIIAAALCGGGLAAPRRAIADGHAETSAEQDGWADDLPASGQAADQAAHHAPMHIGELLASMVNFGVLVVIIVLMARKPLRQFLEDRRDHVAHELRDARRMKAAAEAKLREYEARLGQLDAEIEQIKAEMDRAGRAERDRMVAAAESKASLMRKDTGFLIEQQIKQLRVDLTRETVEAAVRTAADVLRGQLRPEDHERLAREYLARLTRSADGGHA